MGKWTVALQEREGQYGQGKVECDLLPSFTIFLLQSPSCPLPPPCAGLRLRTRSTPHPPPPSLQEKRKIDERVKRVREGVVFDATHAELGDGRDDLVGGFDESRHG